MVHILFVTVKKPTLKYVIHTLTSYASYETYYSIGQLQRMVERKYSYFTILVSYVRKWAFTFYLFLHLMNDLRNWTFNSCLILKNEELWTGYSFFGNLMVSDNGRLSDIIKKLPIFDRKWPISNRLGGSNDLYNDILSFFNPRLLL